MNKIHFELPSVPIGYIAYCLSRAFITDLSRIFSKNNIDITVEQYRTLYVVCKYPGNTQKWISNNLLIDKSSLSRLVNALKSKNLVDKEHIAGAGNQFIIHPTVEGKEVFTKCYTLAIEMTNNLTKNIPKDEYETIRQGMLQLLKNTNRTIPE